MKQLTTIIAFLMIASVGVAAEGQDSQTPRDKALLESAFIGNLDDVQVLVRKGATIDATAPKGRTALMLAAANGHTPVVEFLLQQGAEINAKDSDGQTALMYATSGLFPETVKFLLENGADVDVQSKKGGFTALMIAASGGEEELVRLLLEHGANKDIVEKNGRTAIDRARQYGHAAVVTLLEDTPATASDS